MDYFLMLAPTSRFLTYVLYPRDMGYSPKAQEASCDTTSCLPAVFRSATENAHAPSGMCFLQLFVDPHLDFSRESDVAANSSSISGHWHASQESLVSNWKCTWSGMGCLWWCATAVVITGQSAWTRKGQPGPNDVRKQNGRLSSLTHSSQCAML